MMKLEVDKEYWIKAKFKKSNDFNEYPFWFEAVDALDGMMMLKNVSDVKEVIPKREKVVIPKFVADWIEYCKKEKFWALHGAYINMSERLQNWRFKGNNSEIFARAWLDGYEIEKEPLYWVRDKKGDSLLIRNQSVIQKSSGSSVSYQEHHREFYTFTEKEIKDYDERYWAFAVPVEEE